MKVSDFNKPSEVDTPVFNELPPLHKKAVNDFYSQVDYDNKDVVKEVETTIDKVCVQHNVNTNVIYNYIDKELGE